MSATSYLPSGSVFAERFEIGRELGRGGVSVVYAARDRQVGHDVALKLLVPSPAAAQSARERMRREVHAVRHLAHPHIVAVYDFADDGPYSAVIMELVDGEDLDARVRRRGPLAPDDVARLGTEIAAALSAAHARGILHRDVKPQNILIERSGRARLADFGSARMAGDATITRTGAVVGTLAYMAPEVIGGARGDARSDVFSLGMTLFHAAAGRLPDRPSPHLPVPAAVAGHSALAAGAAVPAWLSAVIARATAAAPGDRFPTPAALADALAQRDAAPGPSGLAPAGIGRCALCGGPDPFRLAICATCAGEGDQSDTYVVLERPISAADRDAALAAVAAMLGDDTPTATLVSVLAGERALMKVPARWGLRIVELLRARGLTARAVAGRELWKALPSSFMMLVGAVVAVGFFAGIIADPALIGTTIVVAVTLLAGGTLALRRPAIPGGSRESALSPATRRRVADTLATLPAGPARGLLADVVGRAHAVLRLLDRRDAAGLRVSVDELVDAACASSLDLAALDESLARFDRERRDAVDARWADSLADCERARDAAVQQLLDAVTILGRLGTHAARDDDALERLAEVVREIAGEVRARESARAELAVLLGR